jgi:hypothetical protein
MSDCETEGKDAHDDEHYQLRYAQRVARTYLMSISAGVDRMTKFQLRDEGEGVYYNSGLTTGKGEWSKKLAWYYTACLTQTLKNADFVKDASKDGVCDLVFRERGTGDIIHCLWSPTNEDRSFDYTMPYEGVYAWQTVPGTWAEGVTEELELCKNGTVSVTVSETPVFVRFSSMHRSIVNGRGVYITPESVTSEKQQAQIERMFDEPDSMPKVIYGDTKGLTAPETEVKGSGWEGTVNLGKPYIFTGFGVYDTFGTGKVEIYDAHTDTLLWSSDLGSYMSRSIEFTGDSAATDTLRIVKGDGAFNEIALYGYPAPELSGVKYDVDNSGAFDVLDIVGMQKHLLCGIKLPDAAAGDALADGVLDISDLALMKRALTGGNA